MRLPRGRRVGIARDHATHPRGYFPPRARPPLCIAKQNSRAPGSSACASAPAGFAGRFARACAVAGATASCRQEGRKDAAPAWST